MIALFRLVGSKQMYSFKLPDLSLPPTSTKLLIQGVASCTGLSTPGCKILSGNGVTRSLLGSNTWINLHMIWGTWEYANPFKDIEVSMQNLFFACDQLWSCALLSWHLSGHFMYRSLSGHFLLLYTQWRFCFFGVMGWACYQASSGWQIVQSSSWLYHTKHQCCFTRYYHAAIFLSNKECHIPTISWYLSGLSKTYKNQQS